MATDTPHGDGTEASGSTVPGPDPGSESGASGVPIELDGLRKVYGSTVAVDEVNLRVEPGELLMLLGPSGCGKTTTLRMLAGLEVPSAGTVRIGGEDVTRKHPRKRGLSMVFQNYALYPHKSVYENLEFPLHKMDLTDDERREKIHEAAELLEIDDLLDETPDQLSGGQRQRVAVGRTIVREPRVFLMDEPLSNLDAKLRIKARSEIRDLQQRFGTTTVYVTHDQEEAMSIADRIVIMNDGRIEQVGTPEEVYTRPVNEFVAGFVGEPATNFVECRPDPDDGGATIVPSAPAELREDAGVPADARTLGVRPEDVYLATDAAAAADPSDPIQFVVGVREPQGYAVELTVERGDVALRAWVRDCPDDVRAGQEVEFVLDRDRLHFFDDDGAAIGR
jgi:multiple sugar transport system ATP-binding protein